MSKPSTPKGTRDFLPIQMKKRQFIFDLIKKVFVKYGYHCIETPSFEKTETLMGKYGDEGDKLIFKILNSGDFTKGKELKGSPGEIGKIISSRALRYDLTVPFARFVVQHRNDISFPFKRFQIQPVWRADRPQRGRYREFYQCDADVVGSDSLLYEVELIQIFDEVLSELNINHVIHINNRKILEGIAEVSGQKDKLIDITIALDKLDKIGMDGVIGELEQRGLTESSIEKIKPLFSMNGTLDNKLSELKIMMTDSEAGKQGIAELEQVVTLVNSLGLQSAKINLNVTLARGLDYYTGAIFEVTADDVKIGSICGGGRYDNLTAQFGLKGVSGVGISFGADRIYDVIEELGLWPSNLESGVEVMFANFGEKEAVRSLEYVKYLRHNGISSEVYPDSVKLAKQLKYANDTSAVFVGMIGSDELINNVVKMKDMNSGEEVTLTKTEFEERFSNSSLGKLN